MCYNTTMYVYVFKVPQSPWLGSFFVFSVCVSVNKSSIFMYTCSIKLLFHKKKMTYSFVNTANSTNNLQATYRGQLVTRAATNAYIRKLWSDTLRREFDEISADLTRFVKAETFGLGYSAGDTINIRTIGNLGENQKAAGLPVTFQATTMTSFPITLDRNVEASFMVENIAQMLNDKGLIETAYSERARYALYKGVIGQILGMRAAFNAVAGSVINASANGTLGVGSGASSPIDLNHVLRARTILQQRNFSASDLVLLVSPVQFSQMLANSRIQNVFQKGGVGGEAVTEGIVGSLFGIPVYQTNFIDANSATGWTNGSTTTPTPGFTSSPYFPSQESLAPVALGNTFDPATNASTEQRAVHTAIMLHKDAIALARPFAPKADVSYETIYQSWAFVNSMFYGVRSYRNNGAVIINTNGTIPTMTTQF